MVVRRSDVVVARIGWSRFFLLVVLIVGRIATEVKIARRLLEVP